VSTTIDRVGRSDTGTPARLPDGQGVVERDGVRVHWESYGDPRSPAILLLPSWSIVHSRIWKGQIHYLARHYRVLSFDPRGNGLSDRPQEGAAYDQRAFVADGVAVLDAAGVGSACVAGISLGGLRALMMASSHPHRVDGVFVCDPTVSMLTPTPSLREVQDFDAELGEYEGWAKHNRHHWLADYR
jgi:pimeloyl-ACP methyl ester carboxylesterase